MDLKVYYRKLREIEAGIPTPEVVVVSHETPDGGVAGVRTEVRRAVAARLVVEGKARLATEEEQSAFHEETAEAKRRAEQAAAASRMQITVVSEADLQRLRGGSDEDSKPPRTQRVQRPS